MQSIPLHPKTGKATGIDLGIECFAAVSNGERVETRNITAPPKVNSREARAPLRAERTSAATGAGRQSIFWRGSTCISKAACRLSPQDGADVIRRYDHITIEDLNVCGMVRITISPKASVTRAGTNSPGSSQASCECWP
ncbi:MAG: hypothetical protein IPO77_18930 [Acidobacteria bacterium]|nr:hypothetical protein [Acidobacteriota bacterium]